mmetsp:Transcript_14620/g.55045  ORF Transcript_14620/g.55045 Transcript_14620/m.55045 type:complete len:208 (+) Transcript_14620:1124-1747(+)
MVPKRTALVPEQPVAHMPPIVAPGPGSTGKNRPWGRSCSLRRSFTQPACTVTSCPAASRRTTPSILSIASTMPAGDGTVWPSSEVPDPNATTGTPCLWHALSTAETSAVEPGRTTAAGGGPWWWEYLSRPNSARSSSASETLAAPTASRSSSKQSAGRLAPPSSACATEPATKAATATAAVAAAALQASNEGSKAEAAPATAVHRAA